MVFLGLAIGMLAKGPVAVMICLIPLMIWLTIRREWSVLSHLPWIKDGAVLLVLTVPWYAAAEWATPGFLRYFIIGEHIGRFLVPGWAGDLYGSGHDEARGVIWIFWTGHNASLELSGAAVSAKTSLQRAWTDAFSLMQRLLCRAAVKPLGFPA